MYHIYTHCTIFLPIFTLTKKGKNAAKIYAANNVNDKGNKWKKEREENNNNNKKKWNEHVAALDYMVVKCEAKSYLYSQKYQNRLIIISKLQKLKNTQTHTEVAESKQKNSSSSNNNSITPSSYACNRAEPIPFSRRFNAEHILSIRTRD